MTSKSSFLPRLSLSRNNTPVLPFHNPSTTPLRRQPSEYDMSDLSPRPDDAFLSSNPSEQHRSRRRSPSGHRSPSPPSARYTDRDHDHPSSPGPESKSKSQILFARPPPPIATSTLLYRDEEEGSTAYSRSPPQHPRQHGTTASFARNALTTVSSVLFERGGPSAGPSPSRAAHSTDRQAYEPSTFWRNVQQRERALVKELQHILDAQSAGLVAYLDPTTRTAGGDASGLLTGARSNTSDVGSATPTGGGGSFSSTNSRQQQRRHVVFDDDGRGANFGQVMPVRQPRRKQMGLRSARMAIARNMTFLADLKSEEDAVLTSALAPRKKALEQLKRLGKRQKDISSELMGLELGGQEPLGQELRELELERNAVVREIQELEARLAGLKSRMRSLDGRIEDVSNQREAGLSGYRNALREVDANLSALLKRPPVKPLDVEALRPPKRDEEGNDIPGDVGQSPGGVEFFSLRPERRTVDMARDWLRNEIRILEERIGEVDNDRTALEEGVRVWEQAIKLVSDYETDLHKEMKGETEDDGKGKSKVPTPDEAMHTQLEKLVGVKTGLEKLLLKAEDRRWNLLICAIGAEVEAFKQAEALLLEALGLAGPDEDGHEEGHDSELSEDERRTPQLGRSISGKVSPFKRNGSPRGENLVDVRDEHDDTATTESDNEVPPDLLVSHEEERDHTTSVTRRSFGGRPDQQDDSENVAPGEFLAEHDRDEGDE